MDKAEEAALKAYPHLEQPVFDSSYPKLLFTRNVERYAFVKGYRLAEQDLREEVAACKAKNWTDGFKDGYKTAEQKLGLTWEDVRFIGELINAVCCELFESDATLDEVYREVFHRFQESKAK